MFQVERLLEAQAEGGVVDLVAGAGHGAVAPLEGALIRIHHSEEAFTRVDTHPVVGLAVVHVPEQHARLVAHQLVGHVDVGQPLVHPGVVAPLGQVVVILASLPLLFTKPARVKAELPSAPSLSRVSPSARICSSSTNSPFSATPPSLWYCRVRVTC